MTEPADHCTSDDSFRTLRVWGIFDKLREYTPGAGQRSPQALLDALSHAAIAYRDACREDRTRERSAKARYPTYIWGECEILRRQFGDYRGQRIERVLCFMGSRDDLRQYELPLPVRRPMTLEDCVGIAHGLLCDRVAKHGLEKAFTWDDWGAVQGFMTYAPQDRPMPGSALGMKDVYEYSGPGRHKEPIRVSVATGWQLYGQLNNAPVVQELSGKYDYKDGFRILNAMAAMMHAVRFGK